MKIIYFSLLMISLSLFQFPSTNKANMEPKQLQQFINSHPFSNLNHKSDIWTQFDDSIYVNNNQDGKMEKDKIISLPGQPINIDFSQYSGFVSLDSKNEQALFYYLVESPQNSSTKPLILWLNGGPGCSSLGFGAMEEIGPFRVNSDGKTLAKNPYSWINVANMLFLESPAGVGYSHSNKMQSGDIETARGNLVFLLNWFERFPQYKGRDLYIAGESYAGHYIPQLANLIIQQKSFNLRGIIVGNAFTDKEINEEMRYQYLWSHALVSDAVYTQIKKNCNFTSLSNDEKCNGALEKAKIGNIDVYNIYAPICDPTQTKKSKYDIDNIDPCSDLYVHTYLNDQNVKNAFHVTNGSDWQGCRHIKWLDAPPSTHDVILNLISKGLPVWLFTGDVDAVVPVTSTRRSIAKMGLQISKEWRPWYSSNEVGGYVEEYKGGLVLVTIRGAGHEVPSYQPERALTMITNFLQAKLPPSEFN